MSAARKESDELSPRALRERAMKKILSGVEELVDAKLAAGAGANEFYDQWSSPLRTHKEREADKPSRRHLELCRTKKVSFTKDGYLRLVRRAELDAYLAKFRVVVEENDDEDVEAIVADYGKRGQRRR